MNREGLALVEQLFDTGRNIFWMITLFYLLIKKGLENINNPDPKQRNRNVLDRLEIEGGSYWLKPFDIIWIIRSFFSLSFSRVFFFFSL